LIKIIETRFIKGARTLSDMPSFNLPEIALVGRSNAGKSTLINRVLGRKRLARTSTTPGRTREVNFFLVKLSDADGKIRECILADLPGYGFARVSKEEREKLSRLIVEYISRRGELNVVCLLNDVRRSAGEEELAIRNLAFESGRRLLVVAAKVDKIKKSARGTQLARLAGQYSLQLQDLVAAGAGIDPSNFWQRVLLLIS